MKKNNVTACEEELIQALAAGANERQAAERAGIEEQTVRRRQRTDANLRRAVHEARDRMLDAGRGQLAGLADKAVETLERLMQSDKPSVALAAAKAVLEAGPRLREATEFEERINRFEDDLDDEQTEDSQRPAGEDELILALAAGATVREAAEQAGLGTETEESIARRLADADFRRAVSRARGRMLESALGRLASLASRAAGIFERLMESEQASVARRAAKAVLQLGPRLREPELEERISRLEE